MYHFLPTPQLTERWCWEGSSALYTIFIGNLSMAYIMPMYQNSSGRIGYFLEQGLRLRQSPESPDLRVVKCVRDLTLIWNKGQVVNMFITSLIGQVVFKQS